MDILVKELRKCSALMLEEPRLDSGGSAYVAQLLEHAANRIETLEKIRGRLLDKLYPGVVGLRGDDND